MPQFLKEYVGEIVKYLFMLAVIFGMVYVGNSFSCHRVATGFLYMRPVIDENDLLLVDRRPARNLELQLEDVVCYTMTLPDRVATRFGRVLAFPGETFQVKDGVFIVDSQVRQTAAINGIKDYDIPPILVPKGHLLIMFDKPYSSRPLLDTQLVPFLEIVGRVMKETGGRTQ